MQQLIKKVQTIFDSLLKAEAENQIVKPKMRKQTARGVSSKEPPAWKLYIKLYIYKYVGMHITIVYYTRKCVWT